MSSEVDKEPNLSIWTIHMCNLAKHIRILYNSKHSLLMAVDDDFARRPSLPDKALPLELVSVTPQQL